MNRKYEQLRAKAFSALQEIAKQDADFEQARMLIGAADTEASLRERTVRKSIDTEWISRVEAAIPALDIIIRNPNVTIEELEEVVPVELTRRISEKSIKHLAQHTNLILKIEGDEVTPSRILNVFREESYLTYENKFINTLLVRLAAFVNKRYEALVGGSGVEKNYEFEYGVDFEHFAEDEKRSTAKVQLRIELTSPLDGVENDTDADLNAQFASALERIRRINQAITAYLSSPFVQKMGRNFIRPPVIRTNAILKNKHFKDCLTLWEFIEGYDKTGFSVLGDELAQMPSDDYVSDMYGLLALQYTQFYHGVVSDEVKLLAERQMQEILPEFDRDVSEEELDDYMVYDAEYRKTVPVSRLMNNRKKLSEDERRIREAIEVALRADEILNAELLAAEEEARRLERERIKAEEEARLRKAAMEAAAKRGPIEYRYKRTFLSRYIQSGEDVQMRYNVIKNELLSYQRVKSRISARCETFKQGRASLARINVVGKSLYLYLALTADAYLDKQGVSDASEKYRDTPLLVKIKSERACKRAVALITEMMAALGAKRIEREAEDYRMPYEDDEALLARGLIKRILPAGVTLSEFDELVRADIAASIGPRKEVGRPEQETEDAIPVAAEIAEEDAEIPEAAGDALGFNRRYKRTFLSRYIQSGEDVQMRYNVIKNELLSYQRVKSRISARCETFKQAKAVVAHINVLGKTLYLYLALSPENHLDKQSISDASAKYADTPLLIKVKGDRACKRAVALIAEMMAALGAERLAREAEDYRMPYEDDEALLARGLIKLIAADAVLPTAEPVVEPVTEPAMEETPETGVETPETDAEIPEAAGDALGFNRRYKRTFLSRYIQSGEDVQMRYNVIKNELLSYQRVKARISARCETFKQAKAVVAHINVLGKTLYLYLALSPENHLDKQSISDASAKYADTPLLIKVKGDRACKRAVALIAEMMAALGVERLAREAEDYRMPYEDDEALLARGLIKLIAADAVLPAAEPVAEPVTEPVIEETPETGVETAEEDAEIPEAAGDALGFNRRYKRTFLSRYIQSGEDVQMRYNVIKNELLSYQRVKSRISARCETFKQAKAVVAHINVLGKTLYLYLALSPENHLDKQSISDASAKYADTPLLIKVKGDRACKRAVALIAEMMAALGAERLAREAEDYRMPYEDDEALLARGLIKLIATDAVLPTAEPIAEPVTEPVMEETPETGVETVEQDSLASTADISDDNAWETELGVWKPVEHTVVHLGDIDFNDAEFAHEVTPAMIDAYGVTLQAVVIEEKQFVDRTCLRIVLQKMSHATRKRLRVRTKNLIYLGEQAGNGPAVPYTAAEYAALKGPARKQVLAKAALLQAYNVTRGQLAAVRILKSSDIKMIEKLKRLEASLIEQAEVLSSEAGFRELVKE